VRFASGKTADGERVMTYPELVNMTNALSEQLEIPPGFFYDLQVQFVQFDFDGDGFLESKEAVALVKAVLKQRRSADGFQPEEHDIEVEFRSLDDGGYTVVKELGRGGQGIMYLATKETSPTASWFRCGHKADVKYCIKFYDKTSANAGGVSELIDEFAKMHQFNDGHVAKTYECFQDSAFYYLVNEPYFGGDLTKLAKKANGNNVAMSEGWWRDIYKQCLDGLDYLHRSAQMHCDIKEPNIMIKDDDSFKSPHIVYIDFGLAQGFAKKNTGVSGTPGYIPPETWQQQVWYPQGDIFSLGVVFFQLLAGKVPSSDGTKLGIFTEGARDLMDVGRVTATTQPPWQLFPMQWQGLADLVAVMLTKDLQTRARAAQLLQHPWFQSKSDQPLPPDVLGRVVSGSAEAYYEGELVNELCDSCNLDELRALQRKLDAIGRGGPVPVERFVAELNSVVVDNAAVSDYVAIRSVYGSVQYTSLLQLTLQEKQSRCSQLVVNLFHEMDKDKDGWLDEDEIKYMLASDAYEMDFEDVDQALEELDVNEDGLVSKDELLNFVLKDGRINTKVKCDAGAKPYIPFWNRLFG